MDFTLLIPLPNSWGKNLPVGQLSFLSLLPLCFGENTLLNLNDFGYASVDSTDTANTGEFVLLLTNMKVDWKHFLVVMKSLDLPAGKFKALP